jgi:hypothetical protein
LDLESSQGLARLKAYDIDKQAFRLRGDWEVSLTLDFINVFLRLDHFELLCLDLTQYFVDVWLSQLQFADSVRRGPKLQ